jgi:small conductance mechanosensitive channel
MEDAMKKFLDMLDFESLLNRAIGYLPNVVVALGILFAFWVAFRLARRPMTMVLKRAGFHENLIRLLIDNLFRFVLILFGFVMAAGQLGINVGAMLAGIGVAGNAVGFAAQDSQCNIISGFLIFWDKPFEVGDWVTVAKEYGQVREITLRTTRIRTNNNTFVIIPNKNVIDETLVNHSKHGAMRLEIPVGIAYKELVPKARDVILEAIKGLEGVARDPAPDVVVTQLGSSSVDMNVRVWIDEAGLEQPVFCRVMEASKLALDAAGIEIPYHHLQLFIENVDDRVWQKAASLPKLAASGG